MSKRKKIPKGTDTDIMFESDRTCCVCQTPHMDVQIHHIDGNPSNNAYENLVVLCLQHHNEAEKKGGFGKGLSPELIKKYRDEWYEVVRKRKETRNPHPSIDMPGLGHEELHTALLDALAVQDIRKTELNLQNAEWQEIMSHLHPLLIYTLHSYSYITRLELINAIDCLTGRTRRGMPPEVANAVSHLVINTLPITSLVIKRKTPIKEEDRALIHQCFLQGWALAWDGSKYLKNLSVMYSGLHIMSYILKYAVLNEISVIKESAIGYFTKLIHEAKKIEYKDGERLAEFEMQDALAINDEDAPEMPHDLFDKIRF